ncbi:MAG: glycosyltransferase [Patescibacteria group bacterium]
MRVLHINKFFYERGGAERYFFALSELLEAHGHTVISFAMDDPKNRPSPYQKFFPSRVDFENPRGFGALKALGRMFWSFEVARKLDALIRESKPEIAHIHNIYHQLAPLTVLIVLRKHHIPVVQTLHDYKLVAPNYTLFDRHGICERAKRGYLRTVLGRCIRGSVWASAVEAVEMSLFRAVGLPKIVARFVAPSDFLREKLGEWGIARERIVVAPLPVSPEAAAHPLGDAVLFLGRLSPEKGVSVLLRAWKHAPESARLMIAGTGPESQELQALSESLHLRNVAFLGHVSRERLPEVFAAAHCVVVPSRSYEVSPYVILEAGARGIPVIASRIGGIPELVQHERTGLLVPPDDPAALWEAIEALRSNGLRAEALGKALQSRIIVEYDPERHYQVVFLLYQDILRRVSTT